MALNLLAITVCFVATVVTTMNGHYPLAFLNAMLVVFNIYMMYDRYK